MEIRPATDADWPSIWPFLKQICAAGETFTYPRDVTEDWAHQVWMKPRTVVAVEGATVLGSAYWCPNQLGGGSHVANASFMVDPAHGRRGVGRALAEHVITGAEQDGFHAMQFNAVVETNHHALRLWESLGFAVLTTVPEAFDHPVHGLVGLKLMWRRL